LDNDEEFVLVDDNHILKVLDLRETSVEFDGLRVVVDCVIILHDTISFFNGDGSGPELVSRSSIVQEEEDFVSIWDSSSTLHPSVRVVDEFFEKIIFRRIVVQMLFQSRNVER
jgi:hypothetical protein